MARGGAGSVWEGKREGGAGGGSGRMGNDTVFGQITLNRI